LSIEQILRDEIQESKRWINKADGVYKRDLEKRMQLIYWVLDNMKNPDVDICVIIETRMNEIINKINKTYSIFESDKLHSELRLLHWIFYQICVNQQEYLQSELSQSPSI
jgi:hypothetical protein